MNTNLNFKTYREPPKIGVATTSTLRLFVFFISSSAFSFNVTHIHSPECMYKSVHTHKFCHMLGYTWHWPMVKENRDIALPSHLLPVSVPPTLISSLQTARESLFCVSGPTAPSLLGRVAWIKAEFVTTLWTQGYHFHRCWALWACWHLKCEIFGVLSPCGWEFNSLFLCSCRSFVHFFFHNLIITRLFTAPFLEKLH